MKSKVIDIEPLPQAPLSTPWESGLFEARDGTQIYYERRGQGPVLILCYGLTCQMSHWRHQVRFFEKTHEVIMLDFRGHHRSGLPPNDRNLTVDWCANDVADLITYLGVKSAMVLGHSLGVPIAATAAVKSPKIVKGIVLICGSMEKPFQHMFHSNRLDPVFQITSLLYGIAPKLVTKGWQRFTGKNWFNYFLTAQFGFNPRMSQKQDILRYIEGVHQAPFAVFHGLLSDYEKLDGSKIMEHIHCPTLIIAGENDFITPLYLQEEMAEKISRCEFEPIPGGSHNAHMDVPRRVNRRIERFLVDNNFG